MTQIIFAVLQKWKVEKPHLLTSASDNFEILLSWCLSVLYFSLTALSNPFLASFMSCVERPYIVNVADQILLLSALITCPGLSKTKQ